MRILITGSQGQLSRSILKYYPSNKLILLSRNSLDITDRSNVIGQILSYNPDIVFHFASMTRGEECARDPEKAYEVNVEGTRNVVDACKKINAAILFVSTNEIFDGKKKIPYREDDMPNPITEVGKTKLEAESIIKKELKKYFIIRTSWLYSEWSANFLHAVLRKAKSDKKIELVDDEIGSPTYSTDLAEAIHKLVQMEKYDTYHLTNTGEISRLGFAKKIFNHYSIDVNIIPVPLSKYSRISKPPLYSVLMNTKAKKLGIELPDWDDALDRFLNEHQLV